MRVELAIVAQHNIAVHTAIGANADIVPNYVSAITAVL